MYNETQPLVLVVGQNKRDAHAQAQCLEQAGFGVVQAHTRTAIHAAIYAEPPQCILLPLELTGAGGASLLEELKADNVYGHIPTLVTLASTDVEAMDWARVPADDYLVRPFEPMELVSRVRLCLARAHRDVNANPLTGLPGNITIMREAEYRLSMGTPFAIAYLDLDNFKPFNDKYGFGRGDEVLRMTARILVNAIRDLNSRETHVGHIGGDDFVFITPPPLITTACERVTKNFDLVVPDFYSAEDRARGEIESIDRKGSPQVFPLLSCSIAVVDTTVSHIRHMGDISKRCAEVKKYAKSLSGSSYLVDRRR